MAATSSNSRLNSVPEKMNTFFSEQYHDYFCSQETEDIIFLKIQKEIIESERKITGVMDYHYFCMWHC